MKWICIFLLFLPFCGLTQILNNLGDDEPFIRESESNLKSAESDSAICSIALSLCDIYIRNGNTEKAKYYFRLAQKKTANNLRLAAHTHFFKANMHLLEHDIKAYEQDLTAAGKQLSRFNDSSSLVLRATVWKNLSILAQIHSDNQRASDLLINKAIPLALRSKNAELIANMYKSIAILFMNEQNNAKAAKYLKKANASLIKMSSKTFTLNETVVEIAIITTENYLELDQLRPAKKHLNTAYSILQSFPKSNLNTNYYYNHGLYLYKSKQYKNALSEYQKGLENAARFSDIVWINRIKFSMFRCLEAMNQLPEAKNLLSSLLSDPYVLPGDKANYSLLLAEVCRKLKNTEQEALYLRMHIRLKDSLQTAQNKEQITALEAKFDASEKERKIIALKQEKTESDLISETRKSYIILSVIIALFLFVAILLILRNNRTQRLLIREKELNFRQEVQQLKTSHQVEVSKALLDWEEKERERIARDLHDGIGSRLTGIRMMVNSLDQAGENNTTKVSALLNDSIEEIRKIARDAMPSSLIAYGLKQALSDLCNEFQVSGLHIDFHYFGDTERFSSTFELNCYRIVQELLTNCLKHSKSTEVMLTCSQDSELFCMEYEDNGMGIPADSQKKSGSGLKHINDRVQFLQGSFEIKQPDTGTHLIIEIPTKQL
jgi:signal transduction histidine kinase